MASQRDLDLAYMNCALAVAELSRAKRKKVGSIIVGAEGIIAEGYNGTPVGFNNDCEIWNGLEAITKPEVIHSESNAILKVARSNNSSVGSTMYITIAPCIECAKLIIQAGIIRVVYNKDYPSGNGIELLKEAEIQVERIS